MGGGDPAAKARIASQLPSLPQNIELTESEAVAYMQRLASFVPALAVPFDALKSGVTCAADYGVIAAKVFIAPTLTEAAGVVVVSLGQTQQALRIAGQCLVAHVLGGGDGQFDPCMEKFYYDAVVNGIQDRYFVLLGGTHSSACAVVSGPYSAVNKIPF